MTLTVVTYILVMQRFPVVYRGTSSESLVVSRSTHEPLASNIQRLTFILIGCIALWHDIKLSISSTSLLVVDSEE